MRKIRLELETLEVESFTASSETEKGGTVHAHSEWDTCVAPCPSYDGPGWSCDPTCERTCDAPGSCGPDTWCGTYEEHGCPAWMSWYPQRC